MPKINYKTKMPLSDEDYPKVISFFATRYVKSEIDWGGLSYRGTIYYLDESKMKAVRISPKRFFGLRRRKMELSDKVEQDIIDEIKKIINTKKMEK
ncbi:MAG: hypothetical protein AABY32_07060 [Nanoarchaeota archaeon]|mgnify:CR=1 FL=1